MNNIFSRTDYEDDEHRPLCKDFSRHVPIVCLVVKFFIEACDLGPSLSATISQLIDGVLVTRCQSTKKVHTRCTYNVFFGSIGQR